MQPAKQAELANPAGWKVREVLVKKGEAVKKGQKLVLYDSAAAERELEDELAELKKQRIALQNVQDQFIQATVSGDEAGLRTTKRELETRKLDLSVQERKIVGLREQLKRERELLAPFDGVIKEVNAVEGLASAGLPDVVVSSGSAGYLLEIAVDGPLIGRLGTRAGQNIEVEVAQVADRPAYRLEGTIEEMADAGSRSYGSSENAAGTLEAVPQKLLRIHVADSGLKGVSRLRSSWSRLPPTKAGCFRTKRFIATEKSGLFSRWRNSWALWEICLWPARCRSKRAP